VVSGLRYGVVVYLVLNLIVPPLSGVFSPHRKRDDAGFPDPWSFGTFVSASG
jgi:hypothetical protein